MLMGIPVLKGSMLKEVKSSLIDLKHEGISDQGRFKFTVIRQDPA